MSDPRRDRFSAWQDLDALVSAELDALEPPRRPEPYEAEPSFEDEPFYEVDENDDEEGFIERTAAWLRNRADADALLDAVRAALDEAAVAPDEPPAPSAGEDEPPAQRDPDAAEGGQGVE